MKAAGSFVEPQPSYPTRPQIIYIVYNTGTGVTISWKRLKYYGTVRMNENLYGPHVLEKKENDSKRTRSYTSIESHRPNVHQNFKRKNMK